MLIAVHFFETRGASKEPPRETAVVEAENESAALKIIHENLLCANHDGADCATSEFHGHDDAAMNTMMFRLTARRWRRTRMEENNPEELRHGYCRECEAIEAIRLFTPT
ncbi:MAG: hypothetical protein WCJ29_01640 [bacterium]